MYTRDCLVQAVLWAILLACYGLQVDSQPNRVVRFVVIVTCIVTFAHSDNFLSLPVVAIIGGVFGAYPFIEEIVANEYRLPAGCTIQPWWTHAIAVFASFIMGSCIFVSAMLLKRVLVWLVEPLFPFKSSSKK